jgi:putative chitinase
MITSEQLKQLIPTNKDLSQWAIALQLHLKDYDINTPKRIASFISQCAHESGDFNTINENLNYSTEGLMKTWPSRFPTKEMASKYGRNPIAIANKVYAGRMGNGDEASGDGWKFRGVGLIQLTGKSNHTAFAEYKNMTIDGSIAYLNQKEGAVESACWFWKKHDLNKFADNEDVTSITKIINGGTNGLDDRKLRYEKAIKILGA